jgi:hypothetical protein
VDNQGLERGLSGVAAKVLYTQKRVIVAVGIAGPTLRFRGEELLDKGVVGDGNSIAAGSGDGARPRTKDPAGREQR